MIMNLASWLGLTLPALLVSQTLASPTNKLRRTASNNATSKDISFDHPATGITLELKMNSGICETTPGVNQYSGYLHIGDNMHMFFWFFEARNNPKTAPVATWLQGGPGCSSMVGLFQENGPCIFPNGSTSPVLNPYSFNNHANMLYIDQPIGVGFSYRENNVTSTVAAAPNVWKLLQAFWAKFPQYQNRDFGIFSESYGGHYGPAFANYIQQQNSAISAGKVQGERLNLIALGINNGWFDAALQEKSLIDYSLNNTYKPIITSDKHAQFLDTYNKDCAPAIAKCRSTGSDADCHTSDDTCSNEIQSALQVPAQYGGSALYDFDYYDIRAPSNDPNPPSTYKQYLADPAVTAAISAKSEFNECPDDIGNKFSTTGDNSRSFLPQLSDLVGAGVQVLMWAGDADWYVGD